MKSLALIELEKHNEVLRAYLLALLETEYAIYCFTVSFNYEQLHDLQDHPRITFLLMQEDSSFENYFSTHHKILTCCTLAVVSTIPLRNTFFTQFKFPCKSILVIHKYHTCFKPYGHLDWSMSWKGLKDVLKLVRGWILGYQRRYLKTISQFDGIVMPSRDSYLYAERKNYHIKPLMGFLDFAVNEHVSTQHYRDGIQIVIPGTINNKSRDYKIVIQALQKLVLRLQVKVDVLLLGKPKGRYGASIIEQLEEMENDQLSFTFFYDFISQRQFDDCMESCDFLVLPIARYMKYDVFLEKNGYSCVSGNINDMVKYGIPAIIPKAYPLTPDLENMVARFDEPDELADLILQWIETGRFNILKDKSKALLEAHNAKAKSKQFIDVIENVG